MYKTNPLLWPFLFLTDIVGYALLFWTKFRQVPEAQSILLVRLDQLGDFLLTTPLIRCLRKRFPKARIDVLVRRPTIQIAELNKDITNVITFNPPWFTLYGKHDSWKETINNIRKLDDYDIAIDCHGDPRNMLICALKSRYRVGYGARGFSFLLQKTTDYPKKYVVERLLDLARGIGINCKDTSMRLDVTEQDKKIVNKVKKPYVTVAPAASRKEKEWGEEYWTETLEKLPKKFNIVFVGGPGEREKLERLQSTIHRSSEIMVDTTLRESAALIGEAALHLGVDTVTAHMARAMNTQSVILYTYENPKVWGHPTQDFIALTPPIETKDVLREASEFLA